MLKTQDIATIFDRWAAQNPSPETELDYVNIYTLLVAVVLSAQATDVGVNKATKSLFEVVDTPEKMVKLGEEKLKTYIKTIGLFNSKAKNVIALSEALIENHNSEVPEDRKALEALPGVGKKTAAVILNCAFGEPTIAVDTHVYRVSNRIGMVNTKTADETELKLTKKLSKILPPEKLRHAHHWLILHGRYICKARKPECAACNISELCEYPDKTPS